MDTTPLIDRLIALFPTAKKNTLRDMLSSGRVLINGATAKSLKHPVSEKDKIQVLDLAEAPDREVLMAQGLRMVYYDADMLIVEKPHGLLTSTDAGEKRPTVLRILNQWFRKQNSKNEVHLIHRLDKDASGLLVFARTWDAYSNLKQQFFEHTITRRYDALVHGVPKDKKGKLENLLLEDPYSGIVRPTKDTKLGKLAILEYELIATSRDKKISHVQCMLYTGRKHQIRAQLNAIGHRVVADPLYGSPPTPDEPPRRLALHATHLTLQHPRTKKKMTFDSPMPGGFSHLMKVAAQPDPKAETPVKPPKPSAS